MPKRLQLAAGSSQWAAEASGNQIRVTPDGTAVTVTRLGDRLRVAGSVREFDGEAAASGDVVWVSVEGEVFSFKVTHGARHAGMDTHDHDAFMPPMSATVVRIAVKPGDQVSDGDVLIALEAMKMELAIRAPRDGVVRAIHCQEGELVQPDQVLLDLE